MKAPLAIDHSIIPNITPITDAHLEDTVYQQAWQNELLATLGITRWVRQHSPVVEIDLAQMAQAQQDNHSNLPLANSTTEYIENSNTNLVLYPDNIVLEPSAHINPEQNITNQQNLAVTPSADEPLQSVDNTVYYIDRSDAMVATARTANLTDIAPLVNKLPSPAISQPIAIEAIQIANWLILADSAVLKQHERQAQLWRSIVTNSNASVQYFNFPLIVSSELPVDSAHVMSNQKMIAAAFAGFIYAASQGQSTKLTIGHVTALPDSMLSLTTPSLPTLAQMLAESQFKRAFWLSVTQSS